MCTILENIYTNPIEDENSLCGTLNWNLMQNILTLAAMELSSDNMSLSIYFLLTHSIVITHTRISNIHPETFHSVYLQHFGCLINIVFKDFPRSSILKLQQENFQKKIEPAWKLLENLFENLHNCGKHHKTHNKKGSFTQVKWPSEDQNCNYLK